MTDHKQATSYGFGITKLTEILVSEAEKLDPGRLLNASNRRLFYHGPIYFNEQVLMTKFVNVWAKNSLGTKPQRTVLGQSFHLTNLRLGKNDKFVNAETRIACTW